MIVFLTNSSCAFLSKTAFDVTSPDTTTKSVVTIVSTATLESGSCFRYSSKNASEILSHTLSGCPSVTDSDVNRKVLVIKPLLI